MSVKVSIMVNVQQMDDTSLFQILKMDTAINPNVEDAGAEVVLARQVADRLLGEAQKETSERFGELDAWLQNMEKAMNQRFSGGS